MPHAPHAPDAPHDLRPASPGAARTRRRRTSAALLASAVSVSLVAASAPAVPLGIGDRLFPYLGNPGYDVAAYDLSFVYPGSNSEPLRAVTTIDAWATADLDRINLDFAHGTVESVEVDGDPAQFRTAGEDLVITPEDSVSDGTWVRITVRHTSDPVSADGREGGWVRTGDGLAMANQADAAHLVFPCNDHPSDKAMFTVRVTAPDEYTAVANGLLAGTHRAGGSTTWTYRTHHPMATELTQVSIGRSTVLHRTGPHGLPIRDVVPTQFREALESWLEKTPAQIEWMESKVGRYPFEAYGLLMADAATGFELETQTLSLFERELFTEPVYPPWYVESIMVHELAHQWFGNSVGPRTWSDLWLNEGHATWYEALYAEEKAGKPLRDRMKAAYGASDRWRATGGPPALPKPPEAGHKIGIFRPVVYDGSALVLYALRQEIGRPAFERLEREWVGRHQDATATTEDFVRLAAEVAGRDLDDFFQGWLYGEKTPPMPGHPDWKPESPAKPESSAQPKSPGKPEPAARSESAVGSESAEGPSSPATPAAAAGPGPGPGGGAGGAGRAVSAGSAA
ncbi:M1 family metallopeptidase [Streptomyces sp. NPDC017943]|uniref:M1 family metallopeptidase n=1 Tax=Streptomyces sp. NPDC017943 TaxID=3365019 RepID=UPI00379F4580